MARRETQRKRLSRLTKIEKKRRFLRRQDGMCGICGKPLQIDDANFDHVKPIARGGKHRIWNLQLTHIACNTKKGAGQP